MEVAAARRLFPAAKEYAWLNHAAYSPPAEPVRDAMIGTARMVSEGRLSFSVVIETRARTTQRAATLTGCTPERVAIVRNTTHGIALAAEGLSWRAGDNIVLPNVEFPANVYPWLNLESKGVEIRWVREVDGRVRAEDIAALVDERTRVVAASFVEFTNGYRNDVVALGRICEEWGALFVVDAIQGLGALSLDMDEAGIDVLAAGGHKWLAAPMGIGIACLSERAFATIRPAHIGWLGVRRPEDFLDYDSTPAEDARRFDDGSPNLVGLFGLDAALELIVDVDIAAIERRVLALSDRLTGGLESLGCRVASPRGEGERSGIVSFVPPAGSSEDMCAFLQSRGVVTSPRGGLVRAGCHYWNDESDVDRALTAIDDRLRTNSDK